MFTDLSECHSVRRHGAANRKNLSRPIGNSRQAPDRILSYLKNVLGAIRNCLGPLYAWDIAERATDPPSSGSSACSQSHLKTSEFRQHIKGSCPQWQSFRDQIDSVTRAISEKLRRPSEMPDTMWIETHEARTRKIGGYGIVGENDLPEMSANSVQRPVAFHRNDAVRDDEMHWSRRTNIENAPVDAIPMQNVLGPAVLCARHYTEHILHAQRNASPVVGLDLRHRHHEVRFEYS